MINKPVITLPGLEFKENGEPFLTHSYTLNLVGDWGGANFHRICAWLSQEFCDRAGPGSRTAIWSLRDGGVDGLKQLNEGAIDLTIATPAGLLGKLVSGDGESPLGPAMPHIRALGVLPQNDRMVLALSPKHNITSFSELREKKPALRLAASTDDGTNFIGHVATSFLAAHGVSKAELESWGGRILTRHRPEQCVALVESGEADALLQEAIMTPWWRNLIEGQQKLVPLAAEPTALSTMQQSLNLTVNPLPAGFWTTLTTPLPALDFSDFLILVRDDMPMEVAYLLTWCLVETRHMIEGQYKHIPAERSPLSYPLVPRKMMQTSVPLHDGAKAYFENADLDALESSIRNGVGSPF
jgi:uncharacterized protein